MRGLNFFFVIQLAILASCSPITYQMLKPDPTTYGLRDFIRENKTIWVAKEHTDTVVIFYIGASLGSLTNLGLYMDIPKDKLEVYKAIDSIYVQNPEEGTKTLLDSGLAEDTVVYTVQAGYKILKNSTSEQLHIKYVQGLDIQIGQDMIRRLTSFSAAQRQAREKAIALDIALLQAAVQHRNNVYNGFNNNGGIRVYSPDECIGPIIMGECKGSLAPHGGYHKTCYGQMLNGQCTGPMF
jgi:hypothetical protein